MINRKIRILTIGHSYVIALNRAIVREVARHPDFEVTVAAPSFVQGDLRDLELEPEPEGSPLRMVSLDARWSRWIHVFHYHARPLRRLIHTNEFDLLHAWEEPFVYAGYQIAKSMASLPIRFSFCTCAEPPKALPATVPSFEMRDTSQGTGLDRLRPPGLRYHADSGLSRRARAYPDTGG